MKKQGTLVDFTSIKEMLGGEEKYVQEFAEAAILSFREFCDNYNKYLLSRNETEFRKAGHKIKPVAMMLGVNQIVEEYENEKKQFADEKTTTELEESAKRMNDICSKVLSDLTDITTAK